MPILAEVYSYIPERYNHVTYRWAVDYDQVKASEAQIIVMNRKHSARYSWKKRGTSFRDQEFVSGIFRHMEHFVAFKKKLFSGGRGVGVWARASQSSKHRGIEVTLE